ncbi:MAG: aminotransferase class I/II-fold pyridoxal phosphate-dependent enzyme [Myxococcota bacterium]
MQVSEKLQRFGTTIFAEMTRLATEHQAINLSQGFPDFEGPSTIRDAAAKAMERGFNQYARSRGVVELAEAVAQHQKRFYDIELDPLSEVGVFAGATEALMATMLGLLNPGDEVLMFEPHYDSYPACVAMAHGASKFITLPFPDYTLDIEALERAVSPRTRLVLLNTPHNPTSKVFTPSELDAIADVCRRHDLWVVSDEVYEHMTYGLPHVPMASRPGMRERTLTVSSFGKTFSFTGWKIGWASGPAAAISAIQAAHQFITFSVATPLQHAAAFALQELDDEFYRDLRAQYERRRDHLVNTLRSIGLEVPLPQGAYFALGRFGDLFDGDDIAFARYLTEKVGVAAIPPSAFYATAKEEGARLCRFAFCKRLSTLETARQRLWKHFHSESL